MVHEKENQLEECIRQDDVVQIPTRGIIEHVLVDEEQQGHVDLLPSQQLLFLKTEAFDLGKVRRDLQQRTSKFVTPHSFPTPRR